MSKTKKAWVLMRKVGRGRFYVERASPVRNVLLDIQEEYVNNGATGEWKIIRCTITYSLTPKKK